MILNVVAALFVTDCAETSGGVSAMKHVSALMSAVMAVGSESNSCRLVRAPMTADRVT